MILQNFQSFGVKPLIKIGLAFILIGLLILLLKEFVVFILASIFIAIGALLLSLSYKLWKTSQYQ